MVAGAHAGNNVEAEISDIEKLCDYGNPDMILVPEAFQKKSIDSLYVEKNVGSVAEGAIKVGEFKNYRIKKGAKSHHGGFRVLNDVIYVWNDLNIEDLPFLSDSASRVPYIGKSTDTAIVRISDEYLDVQKVMENGDYICLMESSIGSHKLRSINSNTIALLDEIYASLFESDSREGRYGIFVPESSWARTQIKDEQMLYIIASSTNLSWQEAKEHMDNIDGGVCFPIVDCLREYGTGKIKGIGVLSNFGVVLKDESKIDWIKTEDTQSSPVLLREDRWTKKSTLWMTTMPLLCHPDPQVAHWMIQKALPGSTVVALMTKPVTSRQKPFKTGDNDLMAYHAIIETEEEITGPIVLDPENGTGVLIGIKREDIE